MIWSIVMTVVHAYAIASSVFATLVILKIYRQYKAEVASELEDEYSLEQDLTAECEAGTYYLYDTATMRFITQATSEDEMVEKAKDMFPNKIMLITRKYKLTS